MPVLRTGTTPLPGTPRPGTPLPRVPRERAPRSWDAPSADRRAARYDAPTDARGTRLEAPAGARTTMRAPAERVDGRREAPARPTATRGWIG